MDARAEAMANHPAGKARRDEVTASDEFFTAIEVFRQAADVYGVASEQAQRARARLDECRKRAADSHARRNRVA